MGDMKKIIDDTISKLTAHGSFFMEPGENVKDVEAILWALWEASYRDGYKDGQEDADGL